MMLGGSEYVCYYPITYMDSLSLLNSILLGDECFLLLICEPFRGYFVWLVATISNQWLREDSLILTHHNLLIHLITWCWSIVMAKTEADREPSPAVAHVDDNNHEVKTQNVFSVELVDAIAKDNPSAWSPHMIRLYMVMVLVTLGMFFLPLVYVVATFTNSSLAFSTYSQLYEWLRRLRYELAQRHGPLSCLL